MKNYSVTAFFRGLFAIVAVFTGAIAHAFGATATESGINATVSTLASTGNVRAVLDDGVVTLVGHVGERTDATRIERRVREMAGISRVVNDIDVA